MTQNIQWIVFTDLDGTLLDGRTYSFQAAVPAVKRLQSENIPIIPCTSKTHYEVDALRKALDISDPMITENGSAVFFEDGYFNSAGSFQHKNGLRVIELGKPHKEIIALLQRLRQKFDLEIRPFSEMSSRELAGYTDMSEEEAELAGQRFYSEPFVLLSGNDNMTRVQKFVQSEGFRLLKGNRFYHLLGDSDKGKAVRVTLDLFAEKFPDRKVMSIAIGDSMNDLEMLQAADYPAIVKKSNGQYQQGLHVDNLLKSGAIGPEGWRELIQKLIFT